MRPLIGVSIALLLYSACGHHSNSPPLRGSEAKIRMWLLQEVPLGSSPQQLDQFIGRKRLLKYGEWRGKPFSSRTYPAEPGYHIVSVELGKYQGFPWVRVVAVRWSFDAEEKLRDVKVEKGSDAI